MTLGIQTPFANNSKKVYKSSPLMLMMKPNGPPLPSNFITWLVICGKRPILPFYPNSSAKSKVNPPIDSTIVPADAPAESFSAERAMAHIRVIAQKPHPVGSPENTNVRDYIVGQLEGMGLSPEVQQTTDLTVTFDSTGLTAPAANSGLLCLNSNDPSHSVMAVPVSLQVTYNFSGFIAPISNAPTMNSAQAGSVIPVKFSLNGDYGLNIFAAGYPKTQQINCQTLAPSGSAVPTSTVGGTGLMYDASIDQYIYPWKSVKGWAGTCRQLIVRLNDGMEYMAYFSFN